MFQVCIHMVKGLFPQSKYGLILLIRLLIRRFYLQNSKIDSTNLWRYESSCIIDYVRNYNLLTISGSTECRSEKIGNKFGPISTAALFHAQICTVNCTWKCPIQANDSSRTHSTVVRNQEHDGSLRSTTWEVSHSSSHIQRKTVHERGKFRCELCGKKYTLQHSLKKHIKSVHERVRHPCDQCGLPLEAGNAANALIFFVVKFPVDQGSHTSCVKLKYSLISSQNSVCVVEIA